MREPFIVVDFETTGLSPSEGARATEVAAVLVRDGQIADHFESLMNAGLPIPSFIQNLTGITNRMIAGAPPSDQVMRQFHDFIGDTPLIAHNAAFDKKFLDAELARLGRRVQQPIACSMRIARRIYQGAPNHQLGTLVRFAQLKSSGIFHRALADSEMTARLMLAMAGELRSGYGIQEIDFALMRRVQDMAIKNAPSLLKALAAAGPNEDRGRQPLRRIRT